MTRSCAAPRRAPHDRAAARVGNSAGLSAPHRRLGAPVPVDASAARIIASCIKIGPAQGPQGGSLDSALDVLNRSPPPAGTGTPVVIDVDKVGKRYPARGASPVVALEDINFTVADGEFVAVVGPSGCGKSTLLKILSGLLPTSSGVAKLRGTPITGPRRDIGIVFQSPVLFPWRTVVDNVLLPIDVQRLGRDRHVGRARELLELVGLQGFETRYPWELSGGMQQRVAITRALIHDPAMLLMDEPFGALDAMTREQMNVELQRIWMDRKKTILFITHSIAEAVYLADRVLVMTPRPGRIREILSVDLPRPRPLEIMNTERFGAYVRHIRELFGSHMSGSPGLD